MPEDLEKIDQKEKVSTSNDHQKELYFKLILLCAFTVLLGRGWQCIRWDIPVNSVMKIQNDSEALINAAVIGLGGLFWLSAILSLCVTPGLKRLWATVPLMICSLLLMGLATLYYFKKNQQWPELIEYASQYMSPLLLVWAATRYAKKKAFLYVLLMTIAATFVGHGLYAMNVYPTPTSFYAMLKSIFGMEKETAEKVLYTAGILDMIVAILIFIPPRQVPFVRNAALWYAAAWGLATALARIWAHIDFDALSTSLQQWLHETIMRTPNGTIPLVSLALIHYRCK